MVFQPSLDQDAAEGFYNMVDGLLDDIFQFASLVPRVATHLEAQDYRKDLDEVGTNGLVQELYASSSLQI